MYDRVMNISLKHKNGSKIGLSGVDRKVIVQIYSDPLFQANKWITNWSVRTPDSGVDKKVIVQIYSDQL